MATLTIVLQQYWKEMHKTWVFNALVLCFAFLSSLFLLIKLRRSASKRNFPPSPPKLPLIGNLHWLGQMLINTATNIIFRCVLGRKYEGDVGPEFAQVSVKILDLSLAFSFRDFFPSLGWMDKFTGLDRKVGETFKKLDQFLDRAIKEQEEMKDENKQSEKKNLIQILLDLRNEGTAGSYLTKKSFKGVVMDDGCSLRSQIESNFAFGSHSSIKHIIVIPQS
ncbi:Cytochrome P450 [Dillenia turbinata]|uniref:Cytochrome P450 n=1 Tax=Dillenia turbinata TaxID=194707 RepID=A0AAN8V3B4_9MAGN